MPRVTFGSKTFNRREWVSALILGRGGVLLGAWPRGGQLTGVVPFVGEGNPPMDTPLGQELDGRLFTDLSRLRTEDAIVATDQFYIRTRASRLLPPLNSWRVQVSGPKHSISISARDLIAHSEPSDVHVIECSGNRRNAHFGMLSAASWAGVPVSTLLDRVDAGGLRYVVISGFDTYSTPSETSIPGASWVFPLDDIHASAAFLATKMNGQLLTADHGAPVRLVVPGWYGCCCIKWVIGISLVSGVAEATSQMREYASRTHQRGTPALAREYEPATVDAAAMPIRVEKRRVGERIKYLVAGIAWGGSRPTEALDIRFDPGQQYVPVESVYPRQQASWTFWTHSWLPQRTGRYTIQLRVADPHVRTRRLDAGYYSRTVEISET